MSYHPHVSPRGSRLQRTFPCSSVSSFRWQINGWLISTTSPADKQSFRHEPHDVEKAERFGFDFALSMIKLTWVGGPSQLWDYNSGILYAHGGLA